MLERKRNNDKIKGNYVLKGKEKSAREKITEALLYCRRHKSAFVDKARNS